MKKLTKLIFSCAAVAALAAAVGTAAMAATTAEYDEDAQAIKITTDYAPTGDYTVLAFKGDADVPVEADIIAIDQDDKDAIATIKVKDLVAELEADGVNSQTYTVRVGGGDAAFDEVTFVVSNGEVPPPASDRWIGDANDDKSIDSTDALKILNVYVGLEQVEADSEDFKAMDTNKDGSIDSVDALDVLNVYVGLPGNFEVGDLID